MEDSGLIDEAVSELKANEAKLLTFIARHGGMACTADIKREVLHRRSRLSAAKQLKKLGFIRFGASLRRARSTIYALTPAGKAAAEGLNG